MSNNNSRNFIYCCTIIALCFLWTSCGYLTWLYRLLKFTTAAKADVLSEVVGYVFQALGIYVISLFAKNSFEKANKKIYFISLIIADFIFIILSATAGSLLTVLVFGYIMNLLHGAIAAYYLYLLATRLMWNEKALAFGLGYSVASIASWLISKIGTTNFLTTNYVLIVYAVLIALTVILIYCDKDAPSSSDILYTKQSLQRSTILLAIATIFLLTVARGIGFYFPTADLSSGINLEFSRIFYAVGLTLAGIICDKKRAYGTVTSTIALICPFVMFALTSEVSSSIVFWILSYILFGFLNVYRITVFSDMATTTPDMLWIATFGLLFGRLGDAGGSFIGMSLSDNRIWLVSVTAILFVVATTLLFVLYNSLYMNVVPTEQNEDEKIDKFIQTYDISTREADVLRLILNGNTNPEISASLYISENTVKFHIRNILKKTNCANRKEMIALYKMK